MPWRGIFSVFLLALWMPGLVTCEKDMNNCTFYYWRVPWQMAVRQCELENMELLCYRSKREIDDITENFQLAAAFSTARLELWLSKRDCSSNEMEECLSLHIQKSDSTVWHFFQETCDGESYPFICCVNGSGKRTSTSTQKSTYITTTTTSNNNNNNTSTTVQKKTSDVFEITETSLQTTTHIASTSKFPTCKKVKKRGVWWPETEVGKAALVRCPGSSTGMAQWICEGASKGKWENEGPDMTKCRSLEIKNLKEKFNSSLASDVISELEHIFGDHNKQIFGEDLADIITLMSDLPDRLFQEVEYLPGSARWTSTKTSIDKAMSVLDRVVELHATWQDIDETGRSKVGTRLLSTVDGMGSLLADSMPDKEKEQSIIGKNMALQVMKPTFGESISMPQWVVTSRYSHRGNIMLKKGYDSQLKTDDGNISLVFALYADMTNILSPMTDEGENQTASLNSAVLSTTVTQGRKPMRISNEVRIVMEHLIPNPNQTACVFWNINRDQWDTTGCRRLKTSNATHSECICTHLTNFALLMDYRDVLKDVKQDPFHYITLIGCCLSIVCLFFCIIIFTCSSCKSRHSWGLRYVIHRNLCLCLLIANVVLVAGLEKTSNRKVCALIAGLLHYFFLAAFSWMLLEAVHIYLLLVVVFASRRSHSEKFYMFGYGFPAVVVAITAFARPNKYGTDEICWLSAEKGTIWAFMGPVAAILTLNTAALILAQYKASRISTKDDKVALLKRWLRVTLILFPVLGITWIFGFLYLGKYFEVAGYLFAIFNSFQGVCIFVFHCLMDKKARNMVMDSFKKKNTSINTGSSGTHKKMKERPQNGTKSNSITPVENDGINKASQIQKAFQLADRDHCKKDWSKWRKPWSFCFDMPVTNRDKNSCNKTQSAPQAVIVHWNALPDKNCS